ncbi:MAG: GGDEF domain-containing protein [endosymbiont of Seepiophila jonesi]|uniref:GGDEF domain-containing protein n=1 Tax=endosymbiont of Lamellibrachia luymesi TaxID=2200907 RepID=A0A370DZL9_9GAMM|nr:MAG: GGDEF domain-containing protein [endosymbiont of Seepiophila jonesi]RDH92137.1 MAG: GGDEF domain-containing protein [endosymbiont of Lamellibrachia luymesi]
MVLLSLLLVLINVSLTAIAYLKQKEQLEFQRTEVREQRAREVDGLVQGTYSRLLGIASLIPELDIDTENDLDLAQHISAIVKEHGDLLQIEWGVDTIHYFSKAAAPLFTWGRNIGPTLRHTLVDHVIENEEPASALACRRECRQYVSVPVLQGHSMAGVLVVGELVADTVVRLQRITGAGIAVLVRDQSSNADSKGFLAPWEIRVAALSGAHASLQRLNRAAEQLQYADLSQSEQLQLKNQTLEITAFPLTNDKTDTPAHLLIIEDISGHIQTMESAFRSNITAGVAGILLTELLLLMLLWGPMARLQRVSTTLPLLAKQDYGQARSSLKSTTNESFSHDEIDRLGETTETLIFQLEALQSEINSRTRHLLQRTSELAQQRDFVQGLMDTAQIIIITQRTDGRINSINHFASQLTAYDLETHPSLHFDQLLHPKNLDPETIVKLFQLRNASLDHYHHDCEIITAMGEIRTISWFHARLDVAREDDPAVLSAGIDITERQQAEENLAWLADHDPMTELFNRRRFHIEFEAMLQAAKRYGHTSALLYFDLDQFKDISGHQAGDALLRVVAERLHAVTRESDLLARLGGDEFALALRETSKEEAIGVAQKIQEELSRVEMPVRGNRHKISASIGIVLYPLHGITVHDLMANADLAMYQAKDAGRDCWHLFSADENIREQIEIKINIKEQIEQALLKESFILHFQPIQHISDGRISHYEVLARMQERDGPLIPPGRFIPIAETTGLIHKIDRLILKKAIKRLEQLQQSQRNITFSVNLSGMVVDDPRLLPYLKKQLAKHQVDPGSLVFEVTETAAVSSITAAKQLMEQIKALGCRFALDDFGVGFSSFFYLKQLPVDYVKIDGSFIQQLASNKEDQIFVKALSEVAKGFGKQTIAEFVEDEATLQLLADLGVDYAQGFHIGKPLPELLPE